jgi:tRNA modification GTPase
VFHVKHTIFALASAQGRAGVSIIRLSGPEALATAKTLTGKKLKPRFATYTELIHDGELLDQCVAIWFKAPNSFTGEDCVELHVHGSRAIIDRLYSVLLSMGLTLAEPGEFTRRALENHKLDLTQAEAIVDLVDAESEAQRRQALTQLGGGLRTRYDGWRSELIDLLARLEVYIDFPDEDLPDDLSQAIVQRIDSLEASLREALADEKRGRQIREGYRIVILGEPNAGKSSLFNVLLKAETAIVTPVAGTTRDVLEAQLRIGPYSVLLYDTAGLREAEEIVEREGIRRARVRAVEADLRIWVIDSKNPSEPDPELLLPGDFVVYNKVDRGGVSRETSRFDVSTVTGAGIDTFINALEGHVESALSLQTFPAATRDRHRARLAEAHSHVLSALNSRLQVPELTAEDIRMAINSFEALFGRYDIEQVLDEVFSSFCIGK